MLTKTPQLEYRSLSRVCTGRDSEAAHNELQDDDIACEHGWVVGFATLNLTTGVEISRSGCSKRAPSWLVSKRSRLQGANCP